MGDVSVPAFQPGSQVVAFDGHYAGLTGEVVETKANGKVVVKIGGLGLPVDINPMCLRADGPVWGIPGDLEVGPHYSALSAAPTSWAMAATNIGALRAAGGDGEGEVVAVLDTGIATRHPEFAGKIVEARSFVPGESVEDVQGHGTHVAGTAAGTSPTVSFAPKAKLLVGKCLNNRGSGVSSWTEPAFRWALDAGATVISMSIGGRGFLEGMEPLFRLAEERGVVVSVAAGNDRAGGGVVSVRSSAVVVAAVDRNGRYAAFSNPGANGDTLSVAAPGVDIVSAWPGGGYNSISGTSMSTPMTAGFEASFNSARARRGLPRFKSSDFKRLYATRAIDAGAPGPDRDYGPGLIDGGVFANHLVPHPPAVG